MPNHTGIPVGRLGHRETAWHATDWTEVTPPTKARKVSVFNAGTLTLYVAYPAVSGAWASTANMIPISTGGQLTFDLVLGGTYAVYGADGVAHETRITYEEWT